MRVVILKRLIQFAFVVAIMGICLFLPAGRMDWWNAWLLLGLYVLSILGTFVVLRDNPELIAERARGLRGGKSWDKILSTLMALVGPIAVWITAGLDTRYRWSEPLAGFAVAGGVALAAAGSALTAWAMRSNTFFSGVVRIQKERGHTVASGGPYAFVRHPGYTGMTAFTLGVPLILNSMWTFVPALLTVAVTVLRTALEDRTLRLELDGYAEYVGRVRYRLAPGIW
jgi:protein-S-isoprenylcysteine O-methyltransferase Ste14